MKVDELVRSGQLEEALAEAQNQVRSKPEEARPRVLLFQLQCVLGKWDKALVQLQVLADLNAETFLLARIFGPVVQCEKLRTEIFAGKRTPILFGEPMEWVGLLTQALGHYARREFAAAKALREKAFEAAPATPGKLNGQPFEWLADADLRLGPILEVILEGRYLWVPLCRIQRLQTEKPADLRDLVWLPAQITWANGGQASVHLPVRYPGTPEAKDNALRLARKTDWSQPESECSLGLGQRMLATDQADVPLLECRELELNAAS